MSEICAPYSALAIANYFIDNVPGITNLKLQKLVYFAHGWYLAYKNEPLIMEPVECWVWGPVIKTIYDNFKKYGNQVITEKATDLEWKEGKRFIPYTPYIEEHDVFTKGLLDAIKEIHGKLSAIQLSNATHLEGTPWDTTKKKYGGIRLGCIIDNELIKTYFKQQMEINKREH